MILINTVDTKYFTLDGVRFARIYQPIAQGSAAIGIYNIYDTKQQLKNSSDFTEFLIDGVSYSSQSQTVEAILNVIWSGVSDYDIELLTDRVENIELNQYTGVVVYSTLAELPATGTLLVSYKVSNDPVESNNGYYHWNGSSYVKDYNTEPQFNKEYIDSIAKELIRLHDKSLVFVDFVGTSDATPIHSANNAYIAHETGLVFGVNVTKGQIIIDNGTYYLPVDNISKLTTKYFNVLLNNGNIKDVTSELFYSDFLDFPPVSKDYETSEVINSTGVTTDELLGIVFPSSEAKIQFSNPLNLNAGTLFFRSKWTSGQTGTKTYLDTNSPEGFRVYRVGNLFAVHSQGPSGSSFLSNSVRPADVDNEEEHSVLIQYSNTIPSELKDYSITPSQFVARDTAKYRAYPTAVLKDDGNVLVAFIDGDAPLTTPAHQENGVAKLYNYNTTTTAITFIEDISIPGFNCQAVILSKVKGRIFLVTRYNDFGTAEGANVYIQYSDDDGNSWSDRKLFTLNHKFPYNTNYIYLDLYDKIIEDRDGNLITVCSGKESLSSDNSICLVISRDFGQTWQFKSWIARDDVNHYDYTETAIHNFENRLYVECRSDALSTNVFYFESFDNGETWQSYNRNVGQFQAPRFLLKSDNVFIRQLRYTTDVKIEWGIDDQNTTDSLTFGTSAQSTNGGMGDMVELEDGSVFIVYFSNPTGDSFYAPTIYYGILTEAAKVASGYCGIYIDNIPRISYRSFNYPSQLFSEMVVGTNIGRTQQCQASMRDLSVANSVMTKDERDELNNKELLSR